MFKDCCELGCPSSKGAKDQDSLRLLYDKLEAVEKPRRQP